MNKREYEIKLRDIRSKIKRHHGINCIKYWKKTTEPHFKVMCSIVFKLCNLDYTCFTEVEFKKKGRCDILVISPVAEATIIEILHTEKEDNIIKKKDYYPFPIVKVNTKDFKVDLFNL